MNRKIYTGENGLPERGRGHRGGTAWHLEGATPFTASLAWCEAKELSDIGLDAIDARARGCGRGGLELTDTRREPHRRYQRETPSDYGVKSQLTRS